MRIEILRDAEEELVQAIAAYEEIEPGLGLRLKEEVRQAFRWIEENPLLANLHPKGYRRMNLRIFRYYIAYFIWKDAIWILAVAHAHRRPEYWSERRRSLPD
jgi:toxin ParE2